MGIGQNIKKYIDNNTTGIFDTDIKDEKDLVYFYHLSEMRKSLFNWYDFKENAKLLEIGAGFGALTGLFCEKCANVTAVAENEFRAEGIRARYRRYDNLKVLSYSLKGFALNSAVDFYKVISEDISRITEFIACLGGEKYDYIILTGVIERLSAGHEEFLNALRKCLTSNGRILIATENRYGLKYLCGEGEDITGMPFCGLRSEELKSSSSGFRSFEGTINSISNQSAGHVFSRQGLVSLLEKAGLSNYKFYYPLPDYRFPLQVYTDEYLPQKNIGERVLFYHDRAETLIADEKKLYSDIIDNGVFPFVANSFLIECMSDESDNDGLSSVSFVALTTDRGPEAALTTVIKGDYVEKKPLYQAGRVSISEVYQNVCELKERGLPVIDHELKGDVISMPYITALALMDYMRTISDDRDKIAEIFDRLWSMILDSSDEAPLSENRIKEYVDAANSSEADAAEMLSLDWGPIHKKVYIEMMPMNCFYIDGDIVFFDQEFSRDYFPAKYALYRAIFYSYVNIPEIEKVLPMQEVKDKYGFGEKLWNVFMAEESRFVSEIRRLSDNRFFYDRLGVNEEKMESNAKCGTI